MQVIPTDDTFSYIATPFGDWPTLYLKVAAWTAATIAHPTTGSYTSTINADDLHDAFNDASAKLRCATPSSDPCGFAMRTEDNNADASVTLSVGTRILSGSGHTLDRMIETCFVAARIEGGTYTSATNTHSAVSGYFFGFLNDATRGACWYLLEVTAGAVTVLDSSVFTGGTLTGQIDPTQPFELRIEAVGGGGSVVLSCYLITRPKGGLSETLIFDSIKHSGTTHDNGRAGFIINGQRTVAGSPGGSVAVLATAFDVRFGGVLVMRDEWERAWRSAGKAKSVTVGATTYNGYSVIDSFAGGFQGPSAYDKKFRTYGGAANYICDDSTSEPTGAASFGGFLIASRPCSDPRSQNRSIGFNFTTTTYTGAGAGSAPSAYRAAGIAVRCSGSATPSTSWAPDAGYHVMVYFDDRTPLVKLLVYRWRNGTPTLIASDLSYAGMSQDRDYTLQVEAWNDLDAAGVNNGNVIMRVWIDGSPALLADGGNDTDVEVTSAGNIIDRSTDRVTYGPAEGIFLYGADGDYATLIANWSQGSLTNSLVGSEWDEANYALPGEGDGDLGQTLTQTFSFSLGEQRFMTPRLVEFDSGHVYRNATQPVARRVFKLRALAMPTSQRNALHTFMDTHEGSARPFLWTPTGETTAVLVRFARPVIVERRIGPGHYEIEVELEEVLA